MTTTPTTPAESQHLDQLVVGTLQLARVFSPMTRARILHLAYQASHDWAQRDGPRWPNTASRLQREIRDLPPAAVHAAVPPEDDAFVEAVAEHLANLPVAERLCRFDALLAATPSEDVPQLNALNHMTALLPELAPADVLARFSQIADRAAAVHAAGLGTSVFHELASDATFEALAPQHVAPAIGVLLDIFDRTALDADSRAELLEELAEKTALAPLADQVALAVRLLAAGAVVA